MISEEVKFSCREIRIRSSEILIFYSNVANFFRICQSQREIIEIDLNRRERAFLNYQ